MNVIFWNLIVEGIMIVYLNNTLIFTQTLKDHCKAVCKVLKVWAKQKLFLHSKICEFNKQQIEYLRLVISQNQIAMNRLYKDS